MAFEIFKNWKKTRLKKKNEQKHFNEDEEENIEKINEKIKQIESDAQLALEIFEVENMRHPIDGCPIYLSDNGINAASISLRQIMAEQSAEQVANKKKIDNKYDGATLYSNNPTLAIRLKRKQIHELYPMVDAKLLDEIFYSRK